MRRLIGQSEEGEQRLWERHAQLIEMGDSLLITSAMQVVNVVVFVVC